MAVRNFSFPNCHIMAVADSVSNTLKWLALAYVKHMGAICGINVRLQMLQNFPSPAVGLLGLLSLHLSSWAPLAQEIFTDGWMAKKWQVVAESSKKWQKLAKMWQKVAKKWQKLAKVGPAFFSFTSNSFSYIGLVRFSSRGHGSVACLNSLTGNVFTCIV